MKSIKLFRHFASPLVALGVHSLSLGIRVVFWQAAFSSPEFAKKFSEVF